MACPSSAGIALRATSILLLIGLLALIDISPVLGTIECEELPIEECAFAVSSSGARCVLEKEVKNNAAPQYKCQTSIIMAERPMEWIESEDCIRTCGLQRLSVGLSTDALLEQDFTRRLCFSQCRSKCPNINDLYTKLAAEEGIYLPSLCDSLKPRIRKLGGVQQSEDEDLQDVSMMAAKQETAKETKAETETETETEKETEAEAVIPSKINLQSLQIDLPLPVTPAAVPSPATAPVMPPPMYPIAEEPYPYEAEPYPYEAEPPYYEYPPSLTPAPAPETMFAEEPAPAPAPYYPASYEGAPPPLAFYPDTPSPAPYYYGY